MRKKLLVCGATGFIGRNVAERFSKRQDVELYGTYFDSEPHGSPSIQFIRADLTRKEDVDKAVSGMDIIVQASATTSGAKDIVQKPHYHVTDNAVMNSLLLRSAYDNKVSHFVFFSCTTMYQSSEELVRESDFDANAEMNSNYFGGGWTKVYVEKMCEFYSRIGETKFTAIRHSNIYGPHDKYDLERSHMFGATVTKVMMADEDHIIVWGTGEEQRDLLYVSDLVDFVETVLEKQEEKFAVYNVGYGACFPVEEIVEKIIGLSGRDLKVRHDLSKPTIKTSLALDISKAKQDLGWEPRTSIEEGIKKTTVWYKENLM